MPKYFCESSPSPTSATLYDAYVNVRVVGRGHERRLVLVPNEKMPEGFIIDPAESMRQHFVSFDFEPYLKTTADDVCRALGYSPKGPKG